MDFATELRYTTNLDSGVQMTPLKNSFLSGDQDAHRFIVSCFRSTSRQPVDLTGAGVTGYFIRADQSTVVIDGKVEDNCAVLTLPAACYAKQGRFSLVVKASLGDVIHTILWVEGAVSLSHTGTIIDPGEVVPTLDELLAQIAAMEIATNNANAAADNANQAAANALNNVDEAVARQDETISQLSEEIKAKADAITAGYIAITAPLANETGCDWNLNDVSYTPGAITPKLESNGILRIDFAEDIRGIGLILYVITATSGKNSQYEVSDLTITEASYSFEIADTFRVMIAATGGMVHYFDRVQAGTSIYTLTTEANFRRLQNRIISNQKIWCFGDSLTKGVITGTTAIEQSYPYWLGKFLGNDAVEISNFGVPGASVQDMLAAVQERDFYDNCDIAILMIGTNSFITNGSPDDPTSNIGAYHAAIKHIIDSGKGMTKIVLLNPPKSYRESVPDRWNDEMHYTIQQIAHEYGLDCIDLYKFLPFTPDDTVYYSDDKVHFTGKGYYYIAYIVYNYLANHMTASQIGGSPTFDY